MAAQTISGKVLLRNDTATNWTTENPTLGKGEFGVEIDTGKLKIGDGVTAWNSLAYWCNGRPYMEHDSNGHLCVYYNRTI